MARARLTSAERWFVGLMAVLTFTVLSQFSILLRSGSDASFAKTQPTSHKHISRFAVPVTFNSSLEERSDFSGLVEYIGDDEASPRSDAGGHDDYDRSSQQNDGSEGKDKVFQTANWKKCLDKGSELVDLFSKQSIPKGDESKFTDYNDLKKYGWSVSEARDDPTQYDDMLHGPLQTLKIAFGSKVSDDKWHAMDVTHSIDTKGPDGQTYSATGGKLEMTHDPRDHLIIGENFRSPTHTTKGTAFSANQMTPLKFVSDVLYLTWARKCQQDKVHPASLKYYLTSNIVNQETRSAVREVLGGFLVKKLPSWPGVHFTKGKDDSKFAGLLGTPVGSSIGRLLVQRKSTMGNDRSVVGVWVRREDPGDDDWFIDHGPLLMMLFELSDPPSGIPTGSSCTHVQQIRRSPRRGGGRRPWHNTPPVQSAVPEASDLVDGTTAPTAALQGQVSAAASKASSLFGGATAAASALRGQGSAAASKASGLFGGMTTSKAVSQCQGAASVSVVPSSLSSVNGSSIADWKEPTEVESRE